ncbi:AAA family ATPase [Brevibacillus laterosporus]|uniref:AAA family ATPase n=1 Tax=Brevibacillus laterosporus TaxID=1465 RepID=A0AAP3GAJ3_BRELA|nr:AAA family ATPase [Brevibacillus laterosporus]MCR8982455.1 AAA family ATPase [Brevibacillus laterosporus]MCZ0809611.1 AAA family ATPase [Brevibacillus laterosporus]MCZ0828144.1 AAA family ATPase [Brevibacillus laterosporus]MCZ0852166.1 AAA family ATPase [Brevibacillus laterosporus]
MNFTIFNGPLENFEKIIPTENTTSLTPLVRSMDLSSKGIKHIEEEQEIYESLIVYTDEYSGVADHFIEGFVIYILYCASKYHFKKVYLHNPPIRIVQQLENSNLKFSLKKIEFKHKKVSLKSLTKIKNTFDALVFGQEKVKNELLHTLYPLTNKGVHKPVVIMLYGPSGVGKTETAKLINTMINGKAELFRKQLSMFHNDSFNSYIFGDKTNSFSKDLNDRKTNVILLDEFDKANPIFYSAFYQMFDEGRFIDKYYNVKLDNAIILCTSNYQNEKEIKQKLGSAIFSRFDNFIEYSPLSNEAKMQIIQTSYERELSKFNKKDRDFLEREGILEKMELFLDQFQNARDIQKTMKRLISYPLVQRL